MYVAVVLLVCSAQAVLIALFVTERKKRLAVQTVLERKTLDQQRVEGELEQSRLFIERLATAIPSVLFIYDLVERRNVYVNEASSRVIGYSAQEVMNFSGSGKPMNVPKANRTTRSAAVTSLSRIKRIETVEFMICCISWQDPLGMWLR